MEVLDFPICRYAQDLSRQLRSHALAVCLQSGGFKLRQTYPFLDILSIGCDARVLNRYYRTTVISQCHEHAGRRFPWIACSAAEGHPLFSHLLLCSVDKGQHARRASTPVYQRYAFGS